MKAKNILRLSALLLPAAATAQTNVVDFETENAGYTRLGVYDSWENSPFRTGELQGNVRVVANHLTQKDKSGNQLNGSARILGFQRSRFASNVFGARIDLAETFELTTATKYVHVMIYKETEGRTMLLGLGKRQERAGQSKDVEQFSVLSANTVMPGKWCDAVFPVKGAGGIDIYSLVVVPDCEPTHAATEDHAVYIDNIEVSDDPLPRIQDEDYPVNFDKSETLSRTDRHTNTISLNSPADGSQTITTGQTASKLVYVSALEESFKAKAGETVTAAFGYVPTSNSWMHGYVYLDRGRDGRFDVELSDDNTLPADNAGDLMAFSYYQGKDSQQNDKGNGGAAVQPPSFTIPSGLAPGFYRMRYKIDWDNVDPGGSVSDGNHIRANGGLVADTRLNVHGDQVTVSRGQNAEGTNGELENADGTALAAQQIPFGAPFTFRAVPSPGFTLSHVVVRHGHGLDGDSLVHGTPQYEDMVIPAYAFRDNTFTLPAEYVDGDVRITPSFSQKSSDANPTEDYPLNFGRDLSVTRTDRRLNSFTLSGTASGNRTVTVPSEGVNYVYRDLTSQEASAVAGDEISIAVDYATGGPMHLYLYVDYSEDGQFDAIVGPDGIPAVSSELVSYTYYDGRNSVGEEVSYDNVACDAMPSFTVPEFLPDGMYRARLKVDWASIDPAGRYGDDADGNLINDNGGCIVDFLLNVHGTQHDIFALTENGSINGPGNTGIPLTTNLYQALSIVPTPVADGYEAEKVTIRHGHRFDGPQYVRGNRQWSEYDVDASACTIPADSVNGDIVVTAHFEPTASAEYLPVFSDEFNGGDGSQPATDVWSRSPRQNATWNRWISDSEEVVYVEDGKLVARAIPNPDTATDNVPMITGAIQSKGKFSFKYGKIEARILTHPHTGNFPAFWLMPEDQSDGWPTCGEIDIWEQIDNENTSYQTVHSHWTYDLGNRQDPPSSFNRSTAMDRYHTYGLEWDAATIKWFVDGRQVASYAKKTGNQSALNQGQWPFDKAFYIILNQSVGNGSWAANADVSHTYETLFDWVRVYQKDISAGIGQLSAAFGLDVSPRQGGIVISAEQPQTVSVFDAAGRLVFKDLVEGSRTVQAERGIYIVEGRKVLVP